MNSYTIQAVLFDMDGVIIDSTAEIEKFWQQWTEKENLPFTNDTVVNYIHGRTTIETINELFINSSKKVKDEIYESAIVFDLDMRPELVRDVDTFLNNLDLYIKKIALVTSSPKSRALNILERSQISKYFNYVVTGEDVSAGKPDPEPYLKAASKMNIPVEKCLVFEDSNSGILSALAAGMFVIAVNNEEVKHQRIITRINNFSNLKVHQSKIQIEEKSINIDLINNPN